jgi:hypothetical protein
MAFFWNRASTPVLGLDGAWRSPNRDSSEHVFLSAYTE